MTLNPNPNRDCRPNDVATPKARNGIRAGLPHNPRRLLHVGVCAMLIGLLFWALATMFYAVHAQEGGVVLRFGKYVEGLGTVSPGVHIKLPFGIDEACIENVEELRSEEFGVKTGDPLLILTGDLKVVNVGWAVQYRIKSLPDYLFSMRDPAAALRDVSEAVMRRVVGDCSLGEVVTGAREEIERAARDRTQERLDRYGAGIEIIAVKLKEAALADAKGVGK